MSLATAQIGDESKIESLQVSVVPTEEVPYVWDAQLDAIESAMSKGQADWSTSHEVLVDILAGNGQLWAVHDGDEIVAVVVLDVAANRRMTKLFVRLVAGTRMDEWADEVERLLLELMKIMGADCLEASCRPGLAKFLKGRGWSQKAIIMELKDG